MKEMLSLQELSEIGDSGDILVQLQLSKKMKRPYGDFVNLINRAIDYSAREMGRDKNILKGMSEDQLTVFLISPLRTIGFDISHDDNRGGHCDISIEGWSGMVWLAEAKVYTGYAKLLGGFKQITERYCSGLQNQNHGSLIFYMRDHHNAKEVLGKWEAHLQKEQKEIVITKVPEEPLEFSSEHPHVGSGLPMHVRHHPILIYHQPTDAIKKPTRSKRKVLLDTANK